MANQAAKRHKQSLKKQEKNYAMRSKLRTYLKQARTAITGNSGDMNAEVDKACRELDRMVTKGLIKKNNASRRKSRLMKAFNLAKSGASSESA